MRTRGTPQSSACLLALFLFVMACEDRSTESTSSQAKSNPQSHAPRISTIQAPPSMRDRVRIDTVALHVVPEVVTAPGEVALDLRQVAQITSRIEGQVEKIQVQ